MLGYDMSWAAFWMVEAMAQPWFGHKRVAFLAASQSFTPDTEVTLLSVHLFKKVLFRNSTCFFRYDRTHFLRSVVWTSAAAMTLNFYRFYVVLITLFVHPIPPPAVIHSGIIVVDSEQCVN